ncbi:MAG: ATP-binding protein [Dokdonella sp.]
MSQGRRILFVHLAEEPRMFDDDINTDPARTFYRPVALRSRLHVEAAVMALRMIERRRWHGRLVSNGMLRDDDILALVGLEESEQRQGRLTVTALRSEFARQLKRLEPRLRKSPDALAKNIARFGALLGLNSHESRLLRLAVLATMANGFADLFRHTLAVPQDLPRAVHDAAGISVLRVQAALNPSSNMCRASVFENNEWNYSGAANPLELDSNLQCALLSPRFDEVAYLRKLIRQAPSPALTLQDFSHLPDLDVLKQYLGGALARRKRGVNILIYGAPGTGKTEFARTLAQALDAQLSEVPNEDSGGEAISGRRRFGAYRICQHLLARRRRQLLLFDEVEDVFGSASDSLGGFFALFRGGRDRDSEGLRKGWINEVLESNPVPALWVCNSIDGLDPAYLRRFDLILEFRMPGRRVRRRVIDRYFNEGEISSNCAERLASIEALSPAQVERTARVVRSLRSRDASVRDKTAERLIQSSLQAMGHTTALPTAQLPDYYDPAFLNTDIALAPLAEGLARRGNARLCVYGVPGTGKTAFAHHLGRVLDRPVLAKRGSDLLDMYVGQTEKKIRNAFAEARDDGAILVIDEADGFLRDRSGAIRSWEVTQVNELLTQMEAFDGIFVASTNLIDTLDDASLRRFDFKIRFDALTREQRRAMLWHICESNNDLPLAELAVIVARLDALDNLTPGDFSNVLRQLDVTGQPRRAETIITLLAAEAAMKRDGRRRLIGFVPA